MPNVKGSAITARTGWVKEKFGDDGLKRLRPSLAPDTLHVVEGTILKSTWYPFEIFVDLNEAMLVVERLRLMVARQPVYSSAETGNLQISFSAACKTSRSVWKTPVQSASGWGSGCVVQEHVGLLCDGYRDSEQPQRSAVTSSNTVTIVTADGAPVDFSKLKWTLEARRPPRRRAARR